MRRNIGRWRLAANAGFVLAVLAVAGFGLYQVAGRHWKVQPTFQVRAEFTTIAGVEAGHRVRLQGIDAGVVDRVVPPREPGRPVELVLRIDERLHPLVRSDTVARIVSEGLVGAKLVELTPGRPDAPVVADLARIASERPIEVADLLKKAAGSLARLDTLAHSAERASARSTPSPARSVGERAAWASSSGMTRSIATWSRCHGGASAPSRPWRRTSTPSSRPGRCRGISIAAPTSTASGCCSSQGPRGTAGPSEPTISSSPDARS